MKCFAAASAASVLTRSSLSSSSLAGALFWRCWRYAVSVQPSTRTAKVARCGSMVGEGDFRRAEARSERNCFQGSIAVTCNEGGASC